MVAQLILLVLLAAISFWVLKTTQWIVRDFRANLSALKHIPGYRIAVHPNAMFAAALPRWSRYFNLGEQYTWRYKHSLFSRYKTDLVSIVSVLPLVKTILVADPGAIKYIVAERKKFVKPLLMYGPLAMYGPNVGVSEGAEYQRHKKIVASSNLLENINELAWRHSMKTLDSCFEDWQLEMKRAGQKEVKVQSIVSLTLKMALFVILGAAFSHSPPWRDDSPDAKPGQHKMSFKDAMHSVLENVWYKIALPQFAYKLPYFTHPSHVALSYKEFTQYLCEMIDARRLEGSADNEKGEETGKKKQDLLGAFVAASGEGDGDIDPKRARLTNQEVCSNIYVFLLAGHDTTAHTLAFTFGLLALHPEIQEETHQCILEVLPSRSDEMRYEHVPALRYVLGLFLETLRLYPTVVIIPKYSVEDTLVPVRTFSEDETTSEVSKVHVPAHSQVLIDVPALHYNPHYWGEDVENFRPSRFLDNEETGYKWPREAFMAFSQGARQCLGQKFAQVEAVTLLSEILRRYEVLLDPSVVKEGESVEDARRRLLDNAKTVITLTPKPLPVIFRERR